MTWRTTSRSIAHGPAPSPRGTRVRARRSSATTAARASKVRSPFLVIRETSARSAARKAATAACRGRRLDAGQPDLPDRGLQPVGQALGLDVRRRRGDLDHLEHVEVVRQRRVQRGPQPLRVAALGQPDLEVLRLAGDPGRRRAGVADLGVRREAGRVGHRHRGPAQRPLEGALEVAVAGEPQPAALGVVHPQPLHGRRRRRSVRRARHRGTSCGTPVSGAAASVTGTRARRRRTRSGRRRPASAVSRTGWPRRRGIDPVDQRGAVGDRRGEVQQGRPPGRAAVVRPRPGRPRASSRRTAVRSAVGAPSTGSASGEHAPVGQRQAGHPPAQRRRAVGEPPHGAA